MGVTRSFDGPVAVLTWDDGENRLNPASMDELSGQFAELAERDGPLAVVLTGVGKLFSNGLDLASLGSDLAGVYGLVERLERLVAQLVVAPLYTVAAINGHCFAGGALLGCAFDRRVMRDDRGYWCMNEAEIGLALTEGLWAILENRLPRASAIEAMTTARRYGGPEALAAGIVEELSDEDHLVERAVAAAARGSRLDRATLAHHKSLAHGALAARLRGD
ncbi:MAG: enoyl-CoA hydratase/isomerase family protein [Acidimicrobiales bacterium]